MNISPDFISNATRDQIIERMHSLFLEALRQREQDIIRYIAILAPALGGFFFLLFKKSYMNDFTFFTGVLGIQGILLVGACYATALGYNYRYIVLQLVKIENKTKVNFVILKKWPRRFEVLIEPYRLCHQAYISSNWFKALYGWKWCLPPEIIKVFWWAFVLSIPLISLVACLVLGFTLATLILIITFILALVVITRTACHYGKKLYDICDKELMEGSTSDLKCC